VHFASSLLNVGKVRIHTLDEIIFIIPRSNCEILQPCHSPFKSKLSISMGKVWKPAQLYLEDFEALLDPEFKVKFPLRKSCKN
jgi:hypothetical protein